ncbi:MAG: holin family protein [Gemmobacter sp.]|nr:holin family protein [Gemmobacter sp.]
MGVIGRVIGKGGAVAALEAAAGLASALTPHATRRMELSAEAGQAALDQYGAEFNHPRLGWFDIFVNGLNRLPRPMLALGTLGLFVYAMTDPAGFGVRMQGLSYVPDPLWWLLGAIVAFYFGARETYYFRNRAQVAEGETADRLPDAVPKDGAWSANPALAAMGHQPGDR